MPPELPVLHQDVLVPNITFRIRESKNQKIHSGSGSWKASTSITESIFGCVSIYALMPARIFFSGHPKSHQRSPPRLWSIRSTLSVLLCGMGNRASAWLCTPFQCWCPMGRVQGRVAPPLLPQPHACTPCPVMLPRWWFPLCCAPDPAAGTSGLRRTGSRAHRQVSHSEQFHPAQ